MAYQAYVTKLVNVRKHPNADRLVLGDCFGNTVCVSNDHQEGETGVYFPTDGQLSEEFATLNDLVRRKDAAGNNCGGYMDPNKRNVTSIRLRGEPSDGLFLPLRCLDYCFKDEAEKHLKVGDVIDVLNGHEICRKYIPVRKNMAGQPNSAKKQAKKIKAAFAPLFTEHVDTAQLAYNLNAFKPGDILNISIKNHGTSQRTGYLPKFTGEYDYANMFVALVAKILRGKARDSFNAAFGKPHYEYGYVTGTRRTVLESAHGGFYGSNQFRLDHAQEFEGKLHKGETVYYEVVGFTDSGAPIMGSVENSKTQDKDFIKKYGKTTTFSYGCDPAGENGLPQSDIYVYRMTMTNVDGDVVEYTPEYMAYRCEQMGVKTVQTVWKGILPEADSENLGLFVKEKAEEFYDGADPVGKTHVREGVVIRVVNRPKFTAYKHKNFSFKVLEGIAKVNADAPDMEEAEEVEEG